MTNEAITAAADIARANASAALHALNLILRANDSATGPWAKDGEIHAATVLRNATAHARFLAESAEAAAARIA